jgi:type II secretory pathway component GspD/PulD (secretin)
MAWAQVSILAVLFDVRQAGIIAVLVMFTRILPAAVLMAVLAFPAAKPARAQGPAGGGPPTAPAEVGQAFRAYTLRSARASDAHGKLVQLLSALPVKTDVVVDERGNRFLVHGTAEAHQIVQRLVDSIDRPQPAADAVALSPAVVESYPIPAELLPVVMGELRVRFPAHLNVRMAADVPRNQLLVVAPKEVHQQIGDYLRSRAAGSPPAVEEVLRPNASLMYLGRVEGQVVPIQSPWDTLLGKLKGVWGDRLAAVPAVAADPRAAAVATYTVQLTGGGALRLEHDPAAKKVSILGPNEAAANCAKLLTALDRPPREPGITSQVVPLGNARKELVERAVNAVLGKAQGDARAVRTVRPWETSDAAGSADRRRTELVSLLFQKQPPDQELPPKQPPGESPLAGGLAGNVEVYIIPELDLIILRGRDADVKKIEELIKEIARNVPSPEVIVHPLQHVDSEALSAIVTQLYSTVYTARSGSVSITPLVSPNALLLIGQKTAVDSAVGLIKRLDTPGSPGAEFEIFRLRHMSARVAQSMLQAAYGANPGPRPTREEAGAAATQPTLPGLFPRIYVLADYRTNSLIVRGAPRDLAEVAKMLSELDRPDTSAELTLRIFPLRNSLASELAIVLQNAIAPPITGAGGPGQQQQQPQQQQFQIPGVPQQQGQQGQARAQTGQLESRSTALRLMTLDAKNKQILTSGILIDVQVTADPRANALLVKAPENSMELIAKLIEQLDQIPGAESQVKVFTVVNGDAQALVQMLVALFGQQAGQPGQPQVQIAPGVPGQPAAQPAVTGIAQGENVLVPLRFAVDTRTNSILATGSVGDLQLVELILDHLSQSDVKDRRTNVYRLRNVPADLVAQAINQYLQNERAVTLLAVPSAFEQIQQEVVVVPEVVTNSLIISATPRFYGEIDKIIRDLDRRPPMVMIQVLIAEVALNNTDEFGVELGLQDSVLFDRSLISDLVTTTTVSQNQTGSQVQQTNIISSTALPGFNFNNQPLGNNPINPGRFGTQALSNFAVGRINGELGYGGLVLSASNESVSVLIRALQECRRLDVLSRPQITTLNNQPAFVQVGQRIQLIQTASVDPTTNIQTNQLGPEQNVGLILGVTPRVADDGRVAMEIDVEKSEVGPEAEGIPISVLTTGDVIRSPRINTTTAQTTVSAMSGQTIVLGGLITQSKSVVHRRVPLLASIPVLGHLFRFDSELQRKTELLIILTPRVIWDEEDAELIKQVESARISWVLSDVQKIHGVHGLRTRWESLDCQDIPVIYPDQDPRGIMIEEEMQIEEVPPPEQMPAMPGASNGRIPPGTYNGGPAPPGTPNGGRGPIPPQGALQRSVLPRSPVASPQGATQLNQPPAGPTRLPRAPDGGPAIAPPQGPTNARPLNTAVPPGGLYPATPAPGALAVRPNSAWSQPPVPRASAVQPAAYQASYATAALPPAAPAPLPRPSAATLAPASSQPPLAPVRFNPPVPQGVPPQGAMTQGAIPQGAVPYRPWGQP